MTRAKSLVVLARVPETGKVKTRLHEAFSTEQCLAIYTAMLRDVLAFAAGARESFDRVSVYWAAGAASRPPQDFERDFPYMQHFMQRGRDLGLRMYNCMADEFARGSQAVVLIGCDSPHLPPKYLRRAVEMLESADVVLGPSDDGGYYLIGASRPVWEPFQGIPWSTSEVMPRTLEILRKSGLRVALLPNWYDLDRPADLERLWTSRHYEGCKQLRKVLAKLPPFRLE